MTNIGRDHRDKILDKIWGVYGDRHSPKCAECGHYKDIHVPECLAIISKKENCECLSFVNAEIQ